MQSGEVQWRDVPRWDLVEHTRGAGVEVATGPVKLFNHFIGVRLKAEEVPADYQAEPEELPSLSFIKEGILDFIVLSEEMRDTVTNFAALKDGGRLIVATKDGLEVSVKDGEDFVNPEPRPHLSQAKTALVVRYGAIGDSMQAASVLPQLKADGYHVTVLCEPTSFEYLKLDPHIDAFIVNDKDQVPNADLPNYWVYLKKQFTRFVNLCESVEGALLKIPGRADYMWPDALRRQMCDHNYLAFMAKIAEVDFHPEHHFYESEDEAKRADEYLWNLRGHANAGRTMGEKSVNPIVIMWALAGTSIHKVYPHQDIVIENVLKVYPEAYFILVGDTSCVILESGWENHPRVMCESGVMPIRDTLALAKKCDIVIGPETGVLNSVAFETNHKVVMLSHSTVKNLTLHWTNTHSLHTKVTKCYPCHRLHYTTDFCSIHEPSRTANCMFDLPPHEVFDAVAGAVNTIKFTRSIRSGT